MIFKILWAFDALVALVIVYFFVVGLGDGSVSSFNGALWFGILAGLTVVMFGSLKLRSAGRSGMGTMLLLALAFPSLMFGLLMLALIVGNPDWK